VEKLVRKLAELQLEVEKLKADKKMLQTNQREDMTNRDKK
jgi:FtsZ-binding cell division protein ZapB